MSSSLEPSAPERPAPLVHPERPAGVERDGAPWPWWLGIVGFVCALAVTAVLGVVVVGIVSLLGVSTTPDLPAGANIALTFVQDAVFIVTPIVLVAMVVGQVSRGAFGLRAPGRPWLAVGLVVGAYIGFLVFTAIYTQVFGITQGQDTLDELGATSSSGALAATAVLVCIGAPIGEELLFRGLIFTSLRRFGLPVAVALTGLIFGAVHFDGSSASAAYIVPLGLLGAALCLLYWRTRSLYPCIALHALNNSIAFGSGVGWDWQIPFLVVGSLTVLAGLAVLFERSRGRIRF